jgi:hypothetical protein
MFEAQFKNIMFCCKSSQWNKLYHSTIIVFLSNMFDKYRLLFESTRS